MMHLERHYRPSPGPLLRGPLCVRSAGHYRVDDGWRESLRGRPFSELFWVVAGRLRFRTPDGPREAGPREVMVHHPGEPHRIEAVGETEYWWATFDGWAEGAALWGDGATRRAWRAGPCPVGRFLRLVAALRDARPEAEAEAAREGQEIHWLACRGLPQEAEAPPEVEECARWMDARFRDIRVDQDGLARAVGRHRTTLFRQFTRYRGMTPAAYLRRLRLAEAIRLLRETRLPVAEVAPRAGFRDPAYLARVVREATGFSPTGFRRGR